MRVYVLCVFATEYADSVRFEWNVCLYVCVCACAVIQRVCEFFFFDGILFCRDSLERGLFCRAC